MRLRKEGVNCCVGYVKPNPILPANSGLTSKPVICSFLRTRNIVLYALSLLLMQTSMRTKPSSTHQSIATSAMLYFPASFPTALTSTSSTAKVTLKLKQRR